MARGKRVEIVKLTVDGVEVDARECTKCGEVKALEEFGVARRKKHGRQSSCRACVRLGRELRRRLNNVKGKRTKGERWTTESFVAYVSEATAGEYACIGEYLSSIDRTEMRHNNCGYEWKTTPSSFLSHGSGCPRCAGKVKTHNDFLIEIDGLTGDEYIVLSEYTTSKTPILMQHKTCLHEWSVAPYSFVNIGTRCPKCAQMASRDRLCKTGAQFCTEVQALVGDEYEVLGEYVNARKKIEMRHNICGERYLTTPDKFLRGNRCPKCASSKGEMRIATYLSMRGHDYVRGYTFDECRYKRPLPFDVTVITSDTVIPIEFDGEHHSRPVDFSGRGANWAELKFRAVQRNDAIKTEYCRANGIPLIRIDYTQFDEIEAILDRELSALGVTGKRNNTDNNDIKRREDAA